MRAFKRVIHAVPMVAALVGRRGSASRFESDANVNLWADSVGEALKQLGLVLTLAIVTHAVARIVIGLSSDLATALR